MGTTTRRGSRTRKSLDDPIPGPLSRQSTNKPGRLNTLFDTGEIEQSVTTIPPKKSTAPPKRAMARVKSTSPVAVKSTRGPKAGTKNEKKTDKKTQPKSPKIDSNPHSPLMSPLDDSTYGLTTRNKRHSNTKSLFSKGCMNSCHLFTKLTVTSFSILTSLILFQIAIVLNYYDIHNTNNPLFNFLFDIEIGDDGIDKGIQSNVKNIVKNSNYSPSTIFLTLFLLNTALIILYFPAHLFLEPSSSPLSFFNLKSIKVRKERRKNDEGKGENNQNEIILEQNVETNVGTNVGTNVEQNDTHKIKNHQLQKIDSNNSPSPSEPTQIVSPSDKLRPTRKRSLINISDVESSHSDDDEWDNLLPLKGEKSANKKNAEKNPVQDSLVKLPNLNEELDELYKLFSEFPNPSDIQGSHSKSGPKNDQNDPKDQSDNNPQPTPPSRIRGKLDPTTIVKQSKSHSTFKYNQPTSQIPQNNENFPTRLQFSPQSASPKRVLASPSQLPHANSTYLIEKSYLDPNTPKQTPKQGRREYEVVFDEAQFTITDHGDHSDQVNQRASAFDDEIEQLGKWGGNFEREGDAGDEKENKIDNKIDSHGVNIVVSASSSSTRRRGLEYDIDEIAERYSIQGDDGIGKKKTGLGKKLESNKTEYSSDFSDDFYDDLSSEDGYTNLYHQIDYHGDYFNDYVVKYDQDENNNEKNGKKVQNDEKNEQKIQTCFSLFISLIALPGTILLSIYNLLTSTFSSSQNRAQEDQPSPQSESSFASGPEHNNHNNHNNQNQSTPQLLTKSQLDIITEHYCPATEESSGFYTFIICILTSFFFLIFSLLFSSLFHYTSFSSLLHDFSTLKPVYMIHLLFSKGMLLPFHYQSITTSPVSLFDTALLLIALVTLCLIIIFIELIQYCIVISGLGGYGFNYHYEDNIGMKLNSFYFFGHWARFLAKKLPKFGHFLTNFRKYSYTILLLTLLIGFLSPISLFKPSIESISAPSPISSPFMHITHSDPNLRVENWTQNDGLFPGLFLQKKSSEMNKFDQPYYGIFTRLSLAIILYIPSIIVSAGWMAYIITFSVLIFVIFIQPAIYDLFVHIFNCFGLKKSKKTITNSETKNEHNHDHNETLSVPSIPPQNPYHSFFPQTKSQLSIIGYRFGYIFHIFGLFISLSITCSILSILLHLPSTTLQHYNYLISSTLPGSLHFLPHGNQLTLPTSQIITQRETFLLNIINLDSMLFRLLLSGVCIAVLSYVVFIQFFTFLNYSNFELFQLTILDENKIENQNNSQIPLTIPFFLLTLCNWFRLFLTKMFVTPILYTTLPIIILLPHTMTISPLFNIPIDFLLGIYNPNKSSNNIFEIFSHNFNHVEQIAPNPHQISQLLSSLPNPFVFIDILKTAPNFTLVRNNINLISSISISNISYITQQLPFFSIHILLLVAFCIFFDLFSIILNSYSKKPALISKCSGRMIENDQSIMFDSLLVRHNTDGIDMGLIGKFVSFFISFLTCTRPLHITKPSTNTPNIQYWRHKKQNWFLQCALFAAKQLIIGIFLQFFSKSWKLSTAYFVLVFGYLIKRNL
jgi:hypothetical protein